MTLLLVALAAYAAVSLTAGGLWWLARAAVGWRTRRAERRYTRTLDTYRRTT